MINEEVLFEKNDKAHSPLQLERSIIQFITVIELGHRNEKMVTQRVDALVVWLFI